MVEIEKVSDTISQLLIQLFDLSTPISKWMSPEIHINIYTMIYEYCTISNSSVQGGQIYSLLQEELKKRMQIIHSQILSLRHSHSFYIENWIRLKESIVVLEGMFQYLNRFWIPQHKEMVTIKQLILNSWKENVLLAKDSILLKSIYSFIENEIFEKYVEEYSIVIDSLICVEMEDDINGWWKALLHAWISKIFNYQLDYEWVLSFHSFWINQKKLSSDYGLTIDTDKDLELILAPKMEKINMITIELLSQNGIVDLSKFFSLFSHSFDLFFKWTLSIKDGFLNRISTRLPPKCEFKCIIISMLSVLWVECENIIATCCDDDTEHHKYLVLVKDSAHIALSLIINRWSSVAPIMAEWIHCNVTKISSFSFLEQLVKNCQDKSLFINFYIFYLKKRLLFDSSVDALVEEDILNIFASIYGAGWVGKCRRMLSEYKVSKEDDCLKIFSAPTWSLQNTLVLNDWTELVGDSDFSSTCVNTKAKYIKKHPNRILSWDPFCTTTTINLHVTAKRSILLTMNALQFLLIKDIVQGKVDSPVHKMFDKALIGYYLDNLVEIGLLISSQSGSLCLNTKFKADSDNLNIATFPPLSDSQISINPALPVSPTQEQSMLILQSKIMCILKRERICPLDKLFSRFGDVKRALFLLSEKEFIKINGDAIEYIP